MKVYVLVLLCAALGMAAMGATIGALLTCPAADWVPCLLTGAAAVLFAASAVVVTVFLARQTRTVTRII